MDTRRAFLAGLIIVGAATTFAGGQSTTRAQNQQNPPIIPPPEQKPGQEPAPENPMAPSAEKKILEENEKDIKKKVERLYGLASELKAEVDKTDSSKVLSLNLVRKAEEIEKLAREIKNRSKG